ALRGVDASTGEIAVLESPEQALAGAPSFSADGARFVSSASSPTHPSELFAGTTKPGEALRRITDSNPWLSGIDLGIQDVVRWRSKDGTFIEGVLIKPPGFKPGARYPVVLHVHGGSESVVLNGWQAAYNNWGQVLAARGFIVLYPNYRGSLGRGADFVS